MLRSLHYSRLLHYNIMLRWPVSDGRPGNENMAEFVPEYKRQRFNVTVFSAAFAVLIAFLGTAARAADPFADILKAPELKGAKTAIVIRDLDRDAYLYNLNREKIFIPASNVKLVTGAAAILALGLNWRFHTDIYADSFGGGTVANLYIYGRGDPTLSEEFFPGNADAMDALVGEMVLAGVRSIGGNIILDDSYYPRQKDPAGWEPEDFEWCYAPNTGALSVAGNCLKMKVSAVSRGSGVEVTFDPPVPERYVQINVSRVWKGRTRLKVSAMADGRVKLEGRIRSGRTFEAEYRALDPTALFGWVLEASLERLGVSFNGRIVSAARWKGDRSTFRHIARYSSITLPGIVEEMERESDNFVAEQLLREIGSQRGSNATTDGGRAAAVELMRGFKIADGKNLVMYDGSGLSRLNRMAPEVLDRLLKAFYQSYISSSFLRMLASPGQRGTLKKRLVGTEAEGRLWAKTGALRGVCTMSGYFMRPDGSVASFVVFFNGYTVHSSQVRELQDRIVKVMMRM